MSLEPGKRLSHYEIIEPIGAGGMGQVYSARDPRLDRVVAIKVLLEQTSAEPEARARFEREAKAIASLAHPHICAVHDVGTDDGTDFIVMELLEGETLARRLGRGALRLDQAIQYGTEIADALDKAHRRGVTHRDLKPGNIMVTKSGVKLLDFGLAKLRPPDGLSNFSAAATRDDMTAEGTILGSLQYMAPEQLEGGEVDPRTDIFAFGAVLYEMVTGRKAFEGKSAVSVMSAILKDVPKPVAAVLASAPPALGRLIATCLEKDPNDRWQTARDLFRELKWIAAGSSETAPHTIRSTAAETGRRRGISYSLAVLVALAAGVLGAFGVWLFKPAASTSSEVVRLTLPLEDQLFLFRQETDAVALSADGAQLVYSGMRLGGTTPQLYSRAMNTLEANPVSGTDGARAGFFSPDSRWIGFFADNKLKKVSAAGGVAVDLCDAALAVGGSWSSDGTIYFAPDPRSGLMKVSADGGPCQEVTRVDRPNEISHRWPQVLPGGQALLYTVRSGSGWDEHSVNVHIFKSGENRQIVSGAASGRYVRSGHLVYSRAGRLMAAPFDIATLTTTGPSVGLTEFVREGLEGTAYGVSDSGSIAYVRGHSDAFRRRMVWVDRKGTVEPLAAPPRAYGRPVISLDGQHIAVDIIGATSGVWIYDVFRQALSAFASSSTSPIWTHDAGHLISTGRLSPFIRKAADNSGAEERLGSGFAAVPGSVTPDGKWLVFHGFDPANPATGSDIWKMPLEARDQTQVVVRTPDLDVSPRLSPDGKWLAYAVQSSQNTHVYITPFPGPGPLLQVSTMGGRQPIWSRSGRELFYRRENKVMAVDIRTEPVLSAGSPRELFEGRFENGVAGLAGYDVAADGRFLMVQPLEPEQNVRDINIVLNWTEELKRRAPSGTR